jgi:Kef-type K+ transport system membrane component KefB
VTPLWQTLLTLGGLFLLGLAVESIGRHTRLPRVTLLLLLGIAIGPSGLDLLPELQAAWFPLVAHLALGMVGFLLGARLSLSELRLHGRAALSISLSAVLVTAVLEVVGLGLLGFPLAVALLLAGIAPATAPAASIDVVRESHADGPLSRTLLGVVALDDIWGLVVFSGALALVQSLGGEGGAGAALLEGAREIGGALLVGALLGLPVAYLSGRLRPGEPTLLEALGAVFFATGVALWLEVSFLLTTMTLGAVVANLARHHERPFHAIEEIELPFMILFFVLSGAALPLAELPAIGTLGVAYVLLRAAGRLVGAWLGAVLAGAPRQVRHWMGVALMPQAGVALGLALIASQRLPELGASLLTVVIAATVLFELVGPPLQRLALERGGEIGR